MNELIAEWLPRPRILHPWPHLLRYAVYERDARRFLDEMRVRLQELVCDPNIDRPIPETYALVEPLRAERP
jgi:hypothetical protein